MREHESRRPISNSTLTIGDPFVHSSAPSSLQFKRYRDVEIDWLDFIDGDTARKIRNFQGSGRVKLGTLDFIRKARERAGVDFSSPMAPDPSGFWNEGPIWVSQAATAPVQAVYIMMPTEDGTRYFVPLRGDGSVFVSGQSTELPNPVTYDEMDKFFDEYAAAWQLGALTEDIVKNVPQEIEVLDLGIRAIFENYIRADKLARLYNDLLTNQPPVTQDTWANDATITEMRRKVDEFSIQLAYAKGSKLQLSSMASERGYELPLEKITVYHPDVQKDVTYEEGKLYLKTIKTLSWEVTETRTDYQYESGASGGSVTPIQVPVKVPKSAQIPVYEEVTIGKDPIVLARQRLGKAGFQVYEAQQRDQGWVLEDGTALQLLVEICSRNEAKRLQTAVILHFERPTATGLFPERSALIIKRPLPGMVPVAFPTVSFCETLSYNMHWRGTELGPLVGSINLAPGEERTIATTRTFTEELTSVSSRRSLLEENSSSSQDFATALENEFANETSKSSTSNSSFGLTGSYGPIGGNFSQTNSSTTNIRNAAKELNRIARKTAQSFNRKAQAESSVTTTEKRAVQQTDSSTATVKNTNPGRTLNLEIYQINNLFCGGVFLNDIQITVGSSFELIANSGIFPRRTVRLHELEKVTELLRPEILPIPPSHEVMQNQIEKYWKPLVREFLDTIQDEYGDDSVGPVKPITKDSPMVSRSACVLMLEGESGKAFSPPLNDPPVGDKSGPFRIATGLMRHKDHGGFLNELKVLLQALVVKPEPIVHTDLAVASGAFYLDGQLGVGSLLEPYAQKMRDLEVARTAAEVDRLRLRNLIVGSAGFNYVILARTDGDELRVQLRMPPEPQHRISAFFAGQRIGSFNTVANQTQYALKWAEQKSQDQLAVDLTFYDEATKAWTGYLDPLPN